MSQQQDPTAGDIDNWLDTIEPNPADAMTPPPNWDGSLRSLKRHIIAHLIRNHYYDSEDETCACIASSVALRVDITHMSIVEHSEHVADMVLNLT